MCSLTIAGNSLDPDRRHKNWLLAWWSFVNVSDAWYEHITTKALAQERMESEKRGSLCSSTEKVCEYKEQNDKNCGGESGRIP